MNLRAYLEETHNGKESVGLLGETVVSGDGGGDRSEPETASAQNAMSVYAQQCAACHGPKGKGDGPAGHVMAPPPAPFSTTLKGKSDSWIGSVITQGGPAVGLSPAMPPHPNLSGSQVKDLTQYIKGLNS